MGSDLATSTWCCSFCNFNPRSRMGSDCDVSSYISTTFNFNPRSRMGSDLIRQGLPKTFDKFQSTLPHGERRSIIIFQKFEKPFQSTLPHGERPCAIPGFRLIVIFQSTLPHGERRNRAVPIYARQCISIHAPAWGATFGLFCPVQCKLYFNPRSRMGSDIVVSRNLRAHIPFQSTLPHGERQQKHEISSLFL